MNQLYVQELPLILKSVHIDKFPLFLKNIRTSKCYAVDSGMEVFILVVLKKTAQPFGLSIFYFFNYKLSLKGFGFCINHRIIEFLRGRMILDYKYLGDVIIVI